MSVLMPLLVAAVAIGGMALLRWFVDRAAVTQRLRCDAERDDCERLGCLRGCDDKH